MTDTISRSDLQARLATAHRPVLLEALPARYYDEGHLPGALHAPHEQIGELSATLLPDKATEIVVYCASATCRNSHIAAATLERQGYTNVRVYAGGKQDWTEAGLPLEPARAER